MTAPDPVRLREALDDVRRAATAEAERVLAALRADGWELYRPEDAIKHAYEIGWCRKHDDVARRYDDSPDTYSCWWEDVVEASGEHDIRDFQPVRLVPVESEDRL